MSEQSMVDEVNKEDSQMNHLKGDLVPPVADARKAAPGTTAFTKRRVQQLETAPGFEMWVAVWGNRGRGDVLIGAPTLDELAARWEQITSHDFDRDMAQRIVTLAANTAQVRPW